MSDDLGRTDREHVGRSVEKEIRIDATPEQVWEAWAEPGEIARWFVDRAEGRMEPGATVTWIFDTFDYRLPIDVYATTRGRYLAFGGEPPGRPQALQEVILRRDGGSTVLRLANSGFLDGPEWDEEMAGVDSGWDMALATLKHQLEHHPGVARDHLLVMRPADLSFDDGAYRETEALYTTAAGLSSWLADAVAVGREPLAPGVEVAPVVDGPLAEVGWHGRVLVRTPSEVLLTWPELDAVVGLKAFRMGPSHAVALDFSAWPLAAERREAVEGFLNAAADRLAATLAG